MPFGALLKAEHPDDSTEAISAKVFSADSFRPKREECVCNHSFRWARHQILTLLKQHERLYARFKRTNVAQRNTLSKCNQATHRSTDESHRSQVNWVKFRSESRSNRIYPKNLCHDCIFQFPWREPLSGMFAA